MRGIAERAYFVPCLALGRLLRATRYATACMVEESGERRVRKRRAPFAPLLVALGGPLMRILDTGVRVLPQREWEARERTLWQALHGASIRVDADGALVMPRLAGTALATLLSDAALGEKSRRRAIELAVVALAELHRLGFTHGDAMADNVIVDLAKGAARWVDFETEHDARRSTTWRRADDVRALLSTCLVRTPPPGRVATLRLMVDAYADDEVTRMLAAHFTAALRRPLAFHLGQAALSLHDRREVARLLDARAP